MTALVAVLGVIASGLDNVSKGVMALARVFNNWFGKLILLSILAAAYTLYFGPYETFFLRICQWLAHFFLYPLLPYSSAVKLWTVLQLLFSYYVLTWVFSQDIQRARWRGSGYLRSSREDRPGHQPTNAEIRADVRAYLGQ